MICIPHITKTAGDPIRLVQEDFSVAERRSGVLINRHDDGLDVLVAPTFAPTILANVY
jgi:hypothetical protein